MDGSKSGRGRECGQTKGCTTGKRSEKERVRRKYYGHMRGEMRAITRKWSLGTGGRMYKCQTWMSVACRMKDHQTRWRLGVGPICACHRLGDSCLPGAPAHKMPRRKMRGQGSRPHPCDLVSPYPAAELIVPIFHDNGRKSIAAYRRTVRRQRREA